MPAIPTPDDSTSPQSSSLVARLIPRPSTLIPRQLANDAPLSDLSALNSFSERSDLPKRAIPSIIPTYYNTNGPTPGTVVGIVLGSVAAFLLIIWLLYSLTNLSGGAQIAGEEEIVVRRRTRSPHSRRSRRSSRPEVREYSRSPRRRDTVIVEERRTAAPRPRSVLVEERVRVPNDDVVEVIEEHDDYRSRRGSRRSGGYR